MERLGFNIDNGLKFDEHISSTCTAQKIEVFR